jgi:signal transduction histidine kinase
LEVQFTGLSFTSPERVQFQYRLEGHEAGWQTPASRRVTLSFLPPGDYTFHVIACNNDGLWNEAGDSLAIVMLPFFWQTLWFKAVLISLGAGALALVFFLESRRRLQLKLERIARERELERERARIAQDIHDDLGASLTRIGMLSQSAAGDLHDPPRATLNLTQIYDTARDLTRAMDEIVWAVNPRHDTLESLANYIARFAHDFLSAAQIRCRLDAPLHVPELTVRSEVRHNLFLAFKETLNNAVKHSGATEVRVKLELPADGLRLAIVDNGSGFEQHKTGSGRTGDRVVSGYGMAGIRTRLEQVGGRVEIRSAPGEGTRVELFVPLPATAAHLNDVSH